MFTKNSLQTLSKQLKERINKEKVILARIFKKERIREKRMNDDILLNVNGDVFFFYSKLKSFPLSSGK